MIVALLAACTSPTPIEVHFDAQADGQAVTCGSPVQVDGHTAVVRDLRMFVHDLEQQQADGTWSPVTLHVSPWQSAEGVALLDFEDGCYNGSEAVHTTLQGTRSSSGPVTGLRFQIGVPPAVNHADPLSLPPPLTTTAMHWSWQAGFKFFRMDATMDGKPTKVHLGSTGCDGELGVNITCRHPNRATVSVEVEPTTTPRLTLDLAALLTPTANCMGTRTDPGCAELFAVMALDAHGRPSGSSSLVVGP